MSRSKRHLRIDFDGIFRFGHVGVEGGRDNTARMVGRSDEQGLEVVFLPLLVPVFVLHFFAHIVDAVAGQRELGQDGTELFFVKSGSGNVSLERIGRGLVGKDGALGEIVLKGHARQVEFVSVHETVEAGAGQRVGQQVIGGFGGRREGEGETEILHKSGKNREKNNI